MPSATLNVVEAQGAAGFDLCHECRDDLEGRSVSPMSRDQMETETATPVKIPAVPMFHVKRVKAHRD